MKKTLTICTCDVCKEKLSVDKDYKSPRIQVIFTTEQTEGRSVSPYLYYLDIDLCEKCYTKLLTGKYIFAHGAMGYNTYYFKEEEK